MGHTSPGARVADVFDRTRAQRRRRRRAPTEEAAITSIPARNPPRMSPIRVSGGAVAATVAAGGGPYAPGCSGAVPGWTVAWPWTATGGADRAGRGRGSARPGAVA